nr:hypothetical protein [Streptomyces kasugaensis]
MGEIFRLDGAEPAKAKGRVLIGGSVACENPVTVTEGASATLTPEPIPHGSRPGKRQGHR